jgi:hypothetical protein
MQANHTNIGRAGLFDQALLGAFIAQGHEQFSQFTREFRNGDRCETGMNATSLGSKRSQLEAHKPVM